MTAYRLREITPDEATVQASILQYLAVHPLVAWAHRFNTGAHAVEDVDAKGRKRRRFIRYAFPGCSDVLGQMRDGRFLAVECKAPDGKATDAQRAFLELVAENGGVAVLASSIEDVEAAL